MGAAIFTEFDTVQGSIVADIKAAIDLSTDWSNTSGNIMAATASNGAAMIVDLQDTAPALQCLNIALYRSAGVDKLTRYILWKRTATGAATDPIHVQVFAGPDHLLITTEGPRGGEPGAEDTSYGSYKTCLFLGAIKPYFDSGLDPVPAVVAIVPSAASAQNDTRCWVSRNVANTASWVPAYLQTLTTPMHGLGILGQGALTGLDGKQYLGPWVIWEVTGGIRGRIKDAYFAGPNAGAAVAGSDPVRGVGQRLTYDGKTFQIVQPHRQHGVNVAVGTFQQWWASNQSSNRNYADILIAVPSP